MTNSFTKNILKRLNSFLNTMNHSPITTNNLFFVLDDKIGYGVEPVVSGLSLISSEQIEETVDPLMSKGPSWVHANLVPVGKLNIITLRFGEQVGNPNPNVNVSYEPNLKLRIEGYEDLAN